MHCGGCRRNVECSSRRYLRRWGRLRRCAETCRRRECSTRIWVGWVLNNRSITTITSRGGIYRFRLPFFPFVVFFFFFLLLSPYPLRPPLLPRTFRLPRFSLLRTQNERAHETTQLRHRPVTSFTPSSALPFFPPLCRPGVATPSRRAVVVFLLFSFFFVACTCAIAPGRGRERERERERERRGREGGERVCVCVVCA